MTKTELLLIEEISKLLRQLGAPSHIVSLVNSIDDVLSVEEVLQILQLYNNGYDPAIIDRSSFNSPNSN